MDNAASSPELLNHSRSGMVDTDSSGLFGDQDGNIPCSLTALNVPPVLGRADAAFNSAVILLRDYPENANSMDQHLYLTDVYNRLKDASTQLETVWFSTQRGQFLIPGLKQYYMFVRYICEYVEMLLQFMHTQYSFPRDIDESLFPKSLVDICAAGKKVSLKCSKELHSYIVSCLTECRDVVSDMRSQIRSVLSGVSQARYQKAFDAYTELYKETEHYKSGGDSYHSA